MRTLKRQNEADEKGDQEDDWNGIVTRPHHLVKGVPPFQLSTLEGCNEGPVDRLRGYLVEAGKIAVQPIRIAADVSENLSHGTILLCGFARRFSIVIFQFGDKARHHFVQKLQGSTIEGTNHARHALFLSRGLRLAPSEKHHLPVARADEGEFEANPSFDPAWVVDPLEIEYA